jgi:glycosyltransferase involved in cell wall biosynthesis
MAALLCAKWHGVPTVLEINGAFREQQQIALRSLTGWNRWRGSLSFQMADLIQRWAFRLADQVVVVTDSLKNYMVEQYNVSEERVRVFSNGVNVEKFTPKNKTECKHTLGLRDNKKYIGFVGNLAPWQGVDHLLKAFGLLLHETADCHLLIVGDGAERFKLEVMAERLNINDYVTFTGFVPYTTVVEYINACEFCVAPLQLQQRNQLTGVSPLKVFEYLACAKPVVASNLPDMRFISDHNVGLLCDPANDRSLANHLATLLQLSASELHEMGMRARSLAVNNYSWDVIVDKIVAST